MNNRAEILVIDDEEAIRKLLEITLQSNEYSVRLAEDARQGVIMAASHSPDLILLDLGLPDESGHVVLKKIRAWFTNPIIILSVQSSEDDIVKALDNGANDYLVKPFRTGELLARLRSLLRNNSIESNEPIIHCSELEINLVSRSIKKNADTIKLTVTEYNLLVLLVKNSGRVLTHHYLLRQIWGQAYVTQSQYLRVFIAQLRKKIETDANRPKYIITESGIGYRFVCND